MRRITGAGPGQNAATVAPAAPSARL